MSHSTEKRASVKPNSKVSYSLPSTQDIPEEDDWTKVKDSKEKKKIQNRIAQRIYRNRMKARLEHLEAQVGFQQKGGDDKIDEAEAPPPAAVALGSPVANESPPPPIMGAEQTSSGTTSRSTASQPQPGSSPGFRDDDLHMHNTPPIHQRSPGPPELSPAHLLPHQSRLEEHGKSYQELILDILNSQNQLISKLDHYRSESERQDCSNQEFIRATNKFPPNMGRVGSQSVSAFSFGNRSSPVFSEGRNPGGWAARDSISSMMEQPPVRSDFSPMPTPLVPPMHAPEHGGGGVAGALEMGSDLSEQASIPDRYSPLDERLEYVLEHAAVVGFEHIDSLMASYYSQTFNEASFLASEQRMSRTRRLPSALSKILNAAAEWSDWERRGIHEEIIRIAESMLVSEAGAPHNDLEARLKPLFDSHIHEHKDLSPNAALALRPVIENELPVLWAMIMACASDNRALRQKDRSNAAVATILLLRYSGRLPKEDLLKFIGALL